MRDFSASRFCGGMRSPLELIGSLIPSSGILFLNTYFLASAHKFGNVCHGVVAAE